jgi:DNA invertase Pin-like site-specific DNA recombinase
MVKIGYCRVSFDDQNLERQITLLKDAYPDILRIFEEKMSGRNKDRPQLKEALSYLREGDILIVESYSRVSSSLRDLLVILGEIKLKKAELISIKESSSMGPGATHELIIGVLGAISEYEVSINHQRQMEGIALAKEKGVYIGRARVKMPDNFYICFEKYKGSTREKPYLLKDFMKDTNLKKSTLLKIIEEVKTDTLHPVRLEARKTRRKNN